MELLSACLIGFAPGCLWLWFLRHKDLEPEPKRLVLWVFALGALAGAVTLQLRPWLEPWIPWDPIWARDLVDAFAVTAGVEETLKLVAFLAGAFWLRELDEPMDGIIYGAAAGLGFASFENACYVLLTDAPALVAARAFTATLVHIVCSGALGFCVGMTRMRRRVRRRWLLSAGFAGAVLLHGTYDWLLFNEKVSWLALAGALPLMAVWLTLNVRWAQARSAEYHPGVGPAG